MSVSKTRVGQGSLCQYKNLRKYLCFGYLLQLLIYVLIEAEEGAWESVAKPISYFESRGSWQFVFHLTTLKVIWFPKIHLNLDLQQPSYTLRQRHVHYKLAYISGFLVPTENLKYIYECVWDGCVFYVCVCVCLYIVCITF